MRLALLELRRRPGRFAIAAAALTLLALLLLVLGALLDGLYLNSTGTLRSLSGDAIVFSDDANSQLLRSRVTPGMRAEIEGVAGVEDSGGIGVTLVGVTVPGADDLADGAVVGYERASDTIPEPPEPGAAWVDRSLRSDGVRDGMVLGLGPAQVPVEVIGFVEDSNFLLQGGIWVDEETWRAVQASARPDSPFSPGEWQVIAIDAADDDALVAVDRRTGSTSTLTIDGAVSALPGIDEQGTTFNAVIYATFFVAGLVVALFFALLTLERVALYGVLKAVGTPSSRLVRGLVVQAVVVAAVAFAIGGLCSLALASVLPDAVPAQFEPSRALFVAVGLLVTAVIGSLVSMRRVLAVDPASAVGKGS